MASIQNITAEDMGVRWVISFQYSADNGVTVPWETFEANIPADLDSIRSDELEPAMLELGMVIARGQGHEV